MFKKLLALTAFTGVLIASSAQLPHAGHAIAYNNAEALRRGLPLVPLHGRPARTWTAAKRQQSPIWTTTTLSFDDAAFTAVDGPITQPYNGYNLDCVYPSCGYSRAAEYFSWTANSSPNSLYFYNQGVPTFSLGTNPSGRFRLKRLYCAQALGSAAPLTLVGTINGQTAFAEEVTCTQNGANSNNDAPTLNTYDNLPLVDRIQVTTTSNNGGWTFDDITLTTSS